MYSNGETAPLLQPKSRPANSPLGSDAAGRENSSSRGKLTWVLTGLWSAIFLGALDATIVATLISPIGSHFRQSQKASYLGTSYLLSSCCFTPLYGRLSDILGRKGAMQLAIALFTSGTLLCGLARSMDVLIIARAIAGMGGGGIMTASSIVMTDLIPLKQRGIFQGFVSILFGLGSGVGGPVGGWINDTFGWRWAFLTQIPFLLISMAIVTFTVNGQLPCHVQAQSKYEKLRQIDWLGSLTLVCTVGCLLLGLSLKTSEDIPWSNPLVWGLLTASGISAMLFVAVETLWSPAPVMPLRMFTQRTTTAVALANLFGGFAGFSMLYNIPLYFSTVRQTNSSQAGLHLLPNSIALLITGILTGWIIRRTGKFYYLMMASALLSVSAAILVATWNEKTSEFRFWFDVGVNGVGGSGTTTTLLIALIANISSEDTAVATGISYLFRTTGQVLGVTLSSALLQAVLIRQLRERITGPGSENLIQRIKHETNLIGTLDPPLRNAAIDSYASALRAVFVCQVCVSVCAFLACLPIKENSLRGSHHEQDEQDGL